MTWQGHVTCYCHIHLLASLIEGIPLKRQLRGRHKRLVHELWLLALLKTFQDIGRYLHGENMRVTQGLR